MLNDLKINILLFSHLKNKLILKKFYYLLYIYIYIYIYGLEQWKGDGKKIGERKDNVTCGAHINVFFANIRRKWGQMRDHLYNFALEVVSCHC